MQACSARAAAVRVDTLSELGHMCDARASHRSVCVAVCCSECVAVCCSECCSVL